MPLINSYDVSESAIARDDKRPFNGAIDPDLPSLEHKLVVNGLCDGIGSQVEGDRIAIGDENRQAASVGIGE